MDRTPQEIGEELRSLAEAATVAAVRVSFAGPRQFEEAQTRLHTAIDSLTARLSAAEADRDSWAEQASQRLADWDEMRKRAEAAEDRAEIAEQAHVCAAEERDFLREQVKDAEAKLAEVEAIAEAAKVWAYCPIQGGYQDGPSIEDTCEALAEAVARYWHYPATPEIWWTEAERDAAIDQAMKEGATK